MHSSTSFSLTRDAVALAVAALWWLRSPKSGNNRDIYVDSKVELILHTYSGVVCQSGLWKEAEGLEKTTVARKWFAEARTAKAAVAVSLVAALGLAGCASSSGSVSGLRPSESSAESGGTDSPAPSEEASSNEGSSNRVSDEERQARRIASMKAKAVQIYKKVLASPEKFARYSKSTAMLPESKRAYHYTMADVDGDGIPELLLRKTFWDLSPVVVVRIDDQGKLHPSKSYILDGYSSDGNQKFHAAPASDGNGLYEYVSANKGLDWDRNQYRLDGDGKLVNVGTEYVGSSIVDSESAHPDWVNVSDSSALETAIERIEVPSGSKGSSETSAGTKPGTNSNKPQKSANKPEKSASKPKPKINRKKFGSNTVVMEGTVRIMSNAQLLNGPMKSLKGRLPSEADKMTDRYPILVLDKPTKLTGYQADPEPRTETVKYVSLGYSSPQWANLNVWQRYDGKRVVVVANQEDFGWPSDASMPLGWLRFAGHETADVIVR